MFRGWPSMTIYNVGVFSDGHANIWFRFEAWVVPKTSCCLSMSKRVFGFPSQKPGSTANRRGGGVLDNILPWFWIVVSASWTAPWLTVRSGDPAPFETYPTRQVHHKNQSNTSPHLGSFHNKSIVTMDMLVDMVTVGERWLMIVDRWIWWVNSWLVLTMNGDA